MMKIVDAEMLSSENTTESAFHVYAAIDWFNSHPDLCERMYYFLTTKEVMHLDPTCSKSVFDIISLRTLEECITKRLKTSKDPKHIATFQSYRRAVITHTKACFDMYCRHHIIRITLVSLRATGASDVDEKNKMYQLDTSVAQLNLIRWLLTHGSECVQMAIQIAHGKKNSLACLVARKKRPIDQTPANPKRRNTSNLKVPSAKPSLSYHKHDLQ